VESMVPGGPGGGYVSNKGDLPCPLFKSGECTCGQMPQQRLCAFFGTCAGPLVDQAMTDFFAAQNRVAVEVQLDDMRREEETRQTREAKTERARGLVVLGATRGHQVPCPTCGMAWHKDDACMHMTCKRCRERFCYVCGRVLSDEGCPPGRGCDRTSPLLEYNAPWEGLTGQEALTSFQLLLIAFHVGIAQLLMGPPLWEALMTMHADLLQDVVPGRSLEPEHVKTLPKPPLCGRSVLSTSMRMQETFRRQCEVLGHLLPQAVSLWDLDTFEDALCAWRLAVAEIWGNEGTDDEGLEMSFLEQLTSVQLHTLRVVFILTVRGTKMPQGHQTHHASSLTPFEALTALKDVNWDAARAFARLRDHHWLHGAPSDPLGVSPEEAMAANEILAAWQDATHFLVVRGADGHGEGMEGLNGRYWRCGVRNNRAVFRQVMGAGHMYWSNGMWRLGDGSGDWCFAIRSTAMMPPMQNHVWTERPHDMEEPLPNNLNTTGPTVSLLSLLEVERDLWQETPQPPILRLTKVLTPELVPYRRLTPPISTYDFIPLQDDVSDVVSGEVSGSRTLRYKRRGMPEYIVFDVDTSMWRLDAAPRTDDKRDEEACFASGLTSVTPPEGCINLHLQHGPQEVAHFHGYQLPPRGLWTWDGHEPSEHHPPLALLECVMWNELYQHPAPLAISVSKAGQIECNGVYVPIAVGVRHTAVYLKRGVMPLTLLQQKKGHWVIMSPDGIPMYASGPRHIVSAYPPEGCGWHLTHAFQKTGKVSTPTKSLRPLVEYIMHEAPSCALTSVSGESAVGRTVRLIPLQLPGPATQAFPYTSAYVDCLGVVVDVDPNNVMQVAFPSLSRPLYLSASSCTFCAQSPFAATHPLEVWVVGAGARRGSPGSRQGSLDGVFRHTVEDLNGKPIYRNMINGALIFFKHGQWKLSPGSLTGWFYAAQSQTHFYDPPGGVWEVDAPLQLGLFDRAQIYAIRPVEVTVTATGFFGGTGQYRQTSIFKGRPCYTQLSTTVDETIDREPYVIWWNPEGMWQMGPKASMRVEFFCRSWCMEPPAGGSFTEWVSTQWDSVAIHVHTRYLTRDDLIACDHGAVNICTNMQVRIRPAAITREIVKAYVRNMAPWHKDHLDACGHVGRVISVTDNAMVTLQFDHPTDLTAAALRLLFPVACCVSCTEADDMGLSLPRLRARLGSIMVERLWVHVASQRSAEPSNGHILQGFYRVCGVFMDRPKYRQEKGEGILYFLETWKLHSEDNVSQWLVRAPFVQNATPSYAPPVHGWLCRRALQICDNDPVSETTHDLLTITVSPAPA
jgi:hypothetical protein